MKSFSEKRLGELIQRTLLAGVVLSLALFAAGFISGALGFARADKILIAGVAALLFTPVARVAMLVYGYRRTGEYKFSLAASIVLALLFASILWK